jgi:hypothetical protein
VGRLCEAIRRRGMSDTKAALTLGVGRSTLSGWKKEHPELEEWLAMAREQFREAKLAIVDEATMRDGRPDWRAAVWALEKAFPEDYGKPARPRREAGRGRMGWRQAASVLENAFPEEYGAPAMAFGPGPGAAWPGPQGSPADWRPTREMAGGLIEENEKPRTQINALLAER